MQQRNLLPEEISLIEKLDEYISKLYKKISYEDKSIDILDLDVYKINMDNLQQDFPIPGLSPLENISFITAWRAIDFIIHFNEIFDIKELAIRNIKIIGAESISSEQEAKLKLYALFLHFRRIHNDIANDLSELFDSFFGEYILNLLMNMNNTKANIIELNQSTIEYYDQFIANIRQNVIQQQINEIILVNDCEKLLNKFLNSSLSDELQFMILDLIASSEIKKNNERLVIKLLECILGHARKGVYAAGIWMIVSSKANTFIYSYFDIPDHLLIIKKLFSSPLINAHNLIIHQCIFALITVRLKSLNENNIMELVSLSKSTFASLDTLGKMRIIGMQCKMIKTIEANERKDLMQLMYLVKLDIGVIIKQFLSQNTDNFVAGIFKECNIPDVVYEYIKLKKKSFKIINNGRLLGEGYRTAGCLFSSLPRDILFKIAAHTARTEEHDMDGAMKMAKKHFFKSG